MKTEFKKPQGFMMTRGQFLRTLGLGAGAAVGVVTGLGRIQQADAQVTQTDVAVYPTGDFPYDVDEVSAAVNGGVGPSGQTYLGGGVVRLKATNIAGAPMFFNFGGDVQGGRGSVSVEKDVTILGEPMPPTTMTFPPFPYDRAPDTEFTPDRTVIYGGK